MVGEENKVVDLLDRRPHWERRLIYELNSHSLTSMVRYQ